MPGQGDELNGAPFEDCGDGASACPGAPSPEPSEESVRRACAPSPETLKQASEWLAENRRDLDAADVRHLEQMLELLTAGKPVTDSLFEPPEAIIGPKEALPRPARTAIEEVMDVEANPHERVRGRLRGNPQAARKKMRNDAMVDAAAAGLSNPAIGKVHGLSGKQVGRNPDVQGVRAVRRAVEDLLILTLQMYFGATPELIESFVRSRIPGFPSKNTIRKIVGGPTAAGWEWRPRSEADYPALLGQVLETRLEILDLRAGRLLTNDEAKMLLALLVDELVAVGPDFKAAASGAAA